MSTPVESFAQDMKAIIDPKVLIGTVAIIGALALILYYLKKFGTKITAPVANVIADAIIPIVVRDPIKVAGNVILPNGIKLSIDSLAMKPGLEFDHQGVRYKFLKRINGDYAAVRI